MHYLILQCQDQAAVNRVLPDLLDYLRKRKFSIIVESDSERFQVAAVIAEDYTQLTVLSIDPALEEEI